MKILLTGSGGQVGYELMRSLQGLGTLIAPERGRLDLSNLAQLRDFLRSERPDLIVNPAAYTAVDKAETEPELAMLVNGEAPGVMAEEARRLGAAMIHYSTDYVFDGSKAEPYSEEDEPRPLNVYGRTKLAGEQAIRASGVPHLIFRTSWVYGARGKNFLLTIKRLAEERDELRIVCDQHGAPTWCRTIADTSAHALVRLQAQRTDGLLDLDRWHAATGVYHLAAQGRTTWHGFAQAIVALGVAGRSPKVTPIPASEFPLPAKRPANSLLSCDKLIRSFSGLPDWDESLRLCLS